MKKNNDLNFYKKNGYLVKKMLIDKKDINKLNILIKKIVNKEMKSKKKVKDQGGTQSYDNYREPIGAWIGLGFFHWKN